MTSIAGASLPPLSQVSKLITRPWSLLPSWSIGASGMLGPKLKLKPSAPVPPPILSLKLAVNALTNSPPSRSPITRLPVWLLPLVVSFRTPSSTVALPNAVVPDGTPLAKSLVKEPACRKPAPSKARTAKRPANAPLWNANLVVFMMSIEG